MSPKTTKLNIQELPIAPLVCCYPGKTYIIATLCHVRKYLA